jgi:hypothetical protein
MARYRVQGPDGAIHVFEGPDGATPDQVTAAAQQQFGGAPAAPAPAAPKPQADDPGVIDSIKIGAGRTTDRILDGITQAYLKARGEESAAAALKQNVDEKAALYKPLADQHPVASAVGEAVPSLAIPVGGGATALGTLGRLGLAGAAPGALEYGSLGERALRATGGAGAAAVGGVVAPVVARAVGAAVPAIGRTVKAIAEPLYDAGRKAIAGRTLNAAAGDAAPAIAARLENAAELVPGSAPTAGQVAESGGIAALERSAAARAPESFGKRAMDQAAARVQALRDIAGDETTMAAAKSVRQTVTKPLFKAAEAQTVTTVDPRLQELLQRPSVAKAIERARALAAEAGRPFGLELGDGTAPGKVTGQALQDIKMGLDALLKDPTSGIAGAEANSVKATRGNLMNWMENAIPELGLARKSYADLSKPINQQQVGGYLLDRLEPALADHGALGRETGNKYALALRNADQTARAATGFKGAGLADTMTPEQMGTLSAIAQDLARRANAQDLGRGVGSNTFQNLAMDNIAARSGAPRVMGAAMNLPGVSKLSKFLYSGPEEEIQSLIGQALLDPKNAAALMRGAPPPPVPMAAGALLRKPSAATAIGGGTAGLALGNLFAQ